MRARLQFLHLVTLVVLTALAVLYTAYFTAPISARYLGTVALVNLGLGLVVALAMYLVGLPNPLLWGAVATLSNFTPYVGPAVATCVIFLAGVDASDTLPAMLT